MDKRLAMKRVYKRIRTIFLLFFFSALVVVGAYGGHRAWMQTSSDLPILTMTIQPKDFLLKIPANGELQSGESMAMAVPNVPVERLRIASVVPDGRHVNKGDVLVEFDPSE